MDVVNVGIERQSDLMRVAKFPAIRLQPFAGYVVPGNGQFEGVIGAQRQVNKTLKLYIFVAVDHAIVLNRTIRLPIHDRREGFSLW